MYHINLLMDEERRIASPLPLRVLLRIGLMLVCCGFAIATLLLVVSRRHAQNQAVLARAEWQDLKPQHDSLLRTRNALADVRNAARQLKACTHARLAWGDELAALQAVVPADVQLTELRVSQTVTSATWTVVAVRSYEMRLSGRSGGEEADVHVRRLIEGLSSPAFSNRLEAVVVPAGGFRPDPARGALRTDRIFDIVCRYRARSFE